MLLCLVCPDAQSPHHSKRPNSEKLDVLTDRIELVTNSSSSRGVDSRTTAFRNVKCAHAARDERAARRSAATGVVILVGLGDCERTIPIPSYMGYSVYSRSLINRGVVWLGHSLSEDFKNDIAPVTAHPTGHLSYYKSRIDATGEATPQEHPFVWRGCRLQLFNLLNSSFRHIYEGIPLNSNISYHACAIVCFSLCSAQMWSGLCQDGSWTGF